MTRIETVEVSGFSALLLECGSRLIPDRQNGTSVVWNRNGTVLESGMNVSKPSEVLTGFNH